MVTILLRGGADPGKINPILKTTPVNLAAAQGKGEILRLLVDKGGTDSLQVIYFIFNIGVVSSVFDISFYDM